MCESVPFYFTYSGRFRDNSLQKTWKVLIEQTSKSIECRSHSAHLCLSGAINGLGQESQCFRSDHCNRCTAIRRIGYPSEGRRSHGFRKGSQRMTSQPQKPPIMNTKNITKPTIVPKARPLEKSLSRPHSLRANARKRKSNVNANIRGR